MISPELLAGLQAALAPLQFASRNGFAQLERVRDLEGTLARALRRLDGAPQAAFWAGELRPLHALLPAPHAPRAERVAALQQLLQRTEALHARWSAMGAAAEPAPRAASAAPAMATPLTMPAPSPPNRPPPVAAAAALGAGEPVMALDDVLTAVPGVGPRQAAALATRQLHTVSDLLHFFPRRYQGQRGQQAIADLVVDQVVSVEGQVQRVADRFAKGRHTLEVVLADATGSLHLMWFRSPGRSFAAQFHKGMRFRAAGTVKRYRQALQIVHPEVRRCEDVGVVVADAAAAPGAGEAAALGPEDKIVPLYLDVEGMHPNQLRRLVARVLPSLRQLDDPLPEALRRARALVPLPEALANLHAPPSDIDGEALEAQATPWHRRLIYDECFFLQLGLFYRRARAHQARRSAALRLPMPLPQLAQKLLPFTLTLAQARALGDVAQDLARKEPMQRLLQGDVGSGKTAVALVAAAAVAQAKMQAAVMAPTELLAEQHARVFGKLLSPHGLQVLLHTGQQAAAERRSNLQAIASGAAQIVVGTHALIQNDVVFHRLRLCVIDEQHRFGVLQRARLTAMGERDPQVVPHLLVMTATPIPRTLALTVYGDLELSLIDSLPPGRTPVLTRLFADNQRAEVYARVREQVEAGRQAYVVFPLVEASDKEGMAEIRAASEQAQELEAGVLRGLRLGLLHGRLTREEKEAVMQAFVRHDIDVLVATTVVEVGIDVANASVMVIEHAERFGLSQLHQLRGRVGRGAAASFCFLLARFRPSQSAWRRLGVMEETNDGFRVAEEDLASRGPGDFTGTRQSGLPVLMMTNLARDGALLVQAREDARTLLARDPNLAQPAHAALRQKLAALWQGRLQLARLA